MQTGNRTECSKGTPLFIAKLKNSVTIAVDPLRVIAFFVACADMATQSIRIISLIQTVNINIGLKYALRDVVHFKTRAQGSSRDPMKNKLALLE